ncbi:ATP-binding cassette domain-containing protein [Nocardiopsis flavescens]|uniref:ABC-2 type transport system ATP-binding protein n=1 Tax=Nocardiopsis flavescens TaxID=758803 RepID=A0A1M6LQH9_9ACTN|nr:ATP-binding cassette domain-containing protein [Nocardiopsis flavescens]SHJ73435.1 ABC-2 type transport system ATP-binding protein [Nocardiopsis flavescens]
MSDGGAGAPVVSTRGLGRSYGDFEAVRPTDLDIAAGEVFGLLGPNGAGKSTMITMLCSMLAPSTGTAAVAGHDVVRSPHLVRRNIGLVFQESTLDLYLTAEQNLRFHADLYGLARTHARERIRRVLEVVGLWDRRGSRVFTYSGGMRRRLEIARGLLHSPRVLFLDEPTIGLDPQTRQAVWEHVRTLHEEEGLTVFMTTHYLDEAENCDRIAIMDAGAVVALAPPGELKAAVGRDMVRVGTDDPGALVGLLEERFSVKAELRGAEVVFAVADGAAFVPRLFTGPGPVITSVSVTRPSLDDVFIHHTGASLRDAEESAQGRPPSLVR